MKTAGGLCLPVISALRMDPESSCFEFAEGRARVAYVMAHQWQRVVY